MCSYIHMLIYVYAHTHIYIYSYLYSYMYSYIYLYMYPHTYSHTYSHTYTHTYNHTCTRTYTHAYMCWYIEYWAKQGVLLLNVVMTVRQGEANSHQYKGWEEFTDATINALKKRQGIVYLLWGKSAQEKCKSIDKKKNTIIATSHPSPLGAYAKVNPFITSKCFSRCNAALIAIGKTEIDWNIPN